MTMHMLIWSYIFTIYLNSFYYKSVIKHMYMWRHCSSSLIFSIWCENSTVCKMKCHLLISKQSSSQIRKRGFASLTVWQNNNLVDKSWRLSRIKYIYMYLYIEFSVTLTPAITGGGRPHAYKYLNICMYV